MRTAFLTEILLLSLLCASAFSLVLFTDWFEYQAYRYEHGDDAREVAKHIWLFFVGSFSLTLPVFFPFRNHMQDWLAKMMVSTLLVQLLWALCVKGNWLSFLIVLLHSFGFTNVQFAHVPDLIPAAFLGVGTFFCVALPLGARNKFLFIDKLAVFFSLLFIIQIASGLPDILEYPILMFCYIAFNILVTWGKTVFLEEQKRKAFTPQSQKP